MMRLLILLREILLMGYKSDNFLVHKLSDL